MSDQEEPWFIRPRDVARLIGIDESTVRQAIYQGNLRARKFQARGWLIERQEVKRWIDARTVANVVEPDAEPYAPLMQAIYREERAMRPEDI